MPGTNRLSDALVGQTAEVISLVRGADPDAPVPTCPGWDLRRLVGHIGQGQRFGADTVRRRVGGPAELTAPTTFPVPDGADAVERWLADGARELVEAVDTVGPDRPVWNFTGRDERAAFWLRRMTHETAVHRADVALTLGVPYVLPADLAADAVSEWLELVTSPGATARRPELAAELRGHGQRLHLHATDPSGTAGRWTIRRGPDGATRDSGGARDADVVVHANASDLLLALLGRIPAVDDRLDVRGDAALFAHWQRHVTF